MIVDGKGEPLAEGNGVPELSPRQEQQAEARTSVTALVLHEAIRKEGDEELERSVAALAWSGLAAGLSMGFSFLSQALLWQHLPDASWRPLVVSLGYPVGFLIVIIGRQQLFTENTLTAIIPLLAKRNIPTLLSVLKLWTVVLVANLVGAQLFAWVTARTPVLNSAVHAAMLQVSIQAADVTPPVAILRGIFAGWLIAMVVWMLAATESPQIGIIAILTYVVGLAGLTHVIVDAVEVSFLVASGMKTWTSLMAGYIGPTLLGNILGGVALVSALNHAQVIAGKAKMQKRQPRLG